MRDILFRGQRIDNGEFVEGNYAFGYIYTSEPIIELDEKYWEHSYGYAPSAENYHLSNRFEVVPETVGQYTGLTDKNGVKIFEGDILEDIEGSVSVVKFGQFKAGKDDWDIEYPPVGFYILFTDGGTYCINLHGDGYAIKAEGCSTIGNIHDNPELLK